MVRKNTWIVIPLIFVSFALHARSVKNCAAGDCGSAVPQPPVEVLLPEEAQKIANEYQAALAELQKAHDEKVAELGKKFIKRLVPLKDQYTKSAKLDEALALRNKIRELQGIVEINQWRAPTKDMIGKKFLVEIVAGTRGSVWGSDPYTADSDLGGAAVHLGLLKSGQKAVIQVEVIEGLSSYLGTSKNDVTSQSYGPWPVAIKLRKAPGL